MTAESDEFRNAPHVLTIRKTHEGQWNRAIFDFLVKYRAAFQPPYPSETALLRASDAGHAKAYARAISQHVAKHVPGCYEVRVEVVADVEEHANPSESR